MRIFATYQGLDAHGNHVLTDVKGDFRRDHAYLNGVYNSLPEIPIGSRIRFFASGHHHNGQMKITDVRELVVL